MANTILTSSVLFATIALAIIALVPLPTDTSGDLVLNRNSRMCYCEIQLFDNYGNPTMKYEQSIRAPSIQSHADENCQTRCDIQFGGAKRYQSVTGSAMPFTSVRAAARTAYQ